MLLFKNFWLARRGFDYVLQTCEVWNISFITTSIITTSITTIAEYLRPKSNYLPFGHSKIEQMWRNSSKR